MRNATFVTTAILSFTLLIAPHATAVAAGCKPTQSVCRDQACDEVGATQLDYDKKSVLSCLYNDQGKLFWKGNQPKDAIFTRYQQNVYGTSNIGSHDYCALSRVRRVAWGSATSADCNLERQSDGTWTLFNKFQRDSDILNGNLSCEVTCMDYTPPLTGLNAMCGTGQTLQGFSNGSPVCTTNLVSMAFGGMYTSTSLGICSYPNRITGSCTCPSGFSPYLQMQTAATGLGGSTRLYICYN